ncbi:phosphate-binding protein PstS [Pseudoclavibacter endophyticus]|nr:phosphate-binding protein PstS [Pseudoclavibacter endophyticus]
MAAIAALTLAACAGDDTAPETDTTAEGGENGGGLSGTLNATGASSQEQAQLNGWIPGFQDVEPGVTVNYTQTGSGTGRDNFVAGQSDFVGSDRAFTTDEIEENAFGACAEGSDIVEFPAYISPIAIGYNLPTVDSLNLDAATLAGIFAGEITTWNAPEIAALNEGVELPETAITAVHRGDSSGTTGNFLGYLEEAAPEAWTHGAEDDFPAALGGESADGTAGVAAAVGGAEGTIGYLDASAAEGLQTVAIQSGSDFVQLSPEAAAAVVAGSPQEEGRAETDVVFELDYTGVDGAYPIVLVSYLIGCAEYQDAEKAELVKAYFSYIITAEGQEAASAAAGNAPISDEIRSAAQAAIDAIS